MNSTIHSITERMTNNQGLPYANVVTISGDVVTRWREQAESRGLKLTLKVESYDLVRIDAVKFMRLLDRLVSNAIKFTPAGSVAITIARAKGWSAPGSIVVSDTGIGMSPRQLAMIFESSSQTETSAPYKLEAVKRCLPMVQNLATSMGCSLDVKSELGKGTRFEVVFPQ